MGTPELPPAGAESLFSTKRLTAVTTITKTATKTNVLAWADTHDRTPPFGGCASSSVSIGMSGC